MKKIVHPSYYVFDPSNNRIDLSTFPDFNLNYLYAIIDVTAGQVIYATGGSPNLAGTYVAPYLLFQKDVTAFSSSDELQIIYHMPAQPIADGDENPILSTVDIDSGKLGLDINLLNSSFGGRIDQPMTTPHEDKALAIGINSGGVLKSPAIDLTSNQLIVDVTQNGNLPVVVQGVPNVDLYSFGGGTGISTASPFPSSIYNPSTGGNISWGAGATDANTPRVTANLNQVTDQNWSAASMSAIGINIITGTSSALDVSGFRSFTCSITSTATAGTFIFEQSNDNVNFAALPVVNSSLISGTVTNAAITATATTVVYAGPVMARYIRCRIATALTGGTVSSTTKLSIFPFVSSILPVAQATASNLNVSATIASGTITSVSSAALQAATATDIASAAITTTTTSANVAMTNIISAAFVMSVTAVSGTTPTLDVVIQETLNGTDYYDIYHFPRITAIGNYSTPRLKLNGIGIRYVRTVAGTTPSFTMSGVRISRSSQAPFFKPFVSRSIDPNTLGSATSAFIVEGCDKLNLLCLLTGAGSGTLVLNLQGSEDQSTWYDLGTGTLSVSAAGSGVLNYSGFTPKFVRAIVSTAGTGMTLNQLWIKGSGA